MSTGLCGFVKLVQLSDHLLSLRTTADQTEISPFHWSPRPLRGVDAPVSPPRRPPQAPSMLKFRFRAFRKFWLVAFVLSSLANLVLSLSLHNLYARKTDLCVLAIISGIALLISLCAIMPKWITLTSLPTLVGVECLWTSCLVPLTMIMSLYSLTLVPAQEHASMAWPFVLVRVFSWSLTGIVTIYPIILLTVAFATAAMVDAEVWCRDITDSPSPFPLALIFYLWRLRFGLVQMPQGTQTVVHPPQCMPGCGCAEKLPPPSPPLLARPALAARSSTRSSLESVVPGIRVPTAMERHNKIVIGFWWV
ncbi:hypothetical protein OF83DRAFT_1173069 [Amylostereum chailletii]|nr:hypothetical protein OF83DRAFT_1173069 [Amylostereum chailletii]